MQKAEVKLGKSKFYAGATYTYFTTDVSFDTIANRRIISKILKRLNVNSTVSAIKPNVTYDSRDNAFTPTRGLNPQISMNYSAEWLGSSDDFRLRSEIYFFDSCKYWTNQADSERYRNRRTVLVPLEIGSRNCCGKFFKGA